MSRGWFPNVGGVVLCGHWTYPHPLFRGRSTEGLYGGTTVGSHPCCGGTRKGPTVPHVWVVSERGVDEGPGTSPTPVLQRRDRRLDWIISGTPFPSFTTPRLPPLIHLTSDPVIPGFVSHPSSVLVLTRGNRVL